MEREEGEFIISDIYHDVLLQINVLILKYDTLLPHHRENQEATRGNTFLSCATQDLWLMAMFLIVPPLSSPTRVCGQAF